MIDSFWHTVRKFLDEVPSLTRKDEEILGEIIRVDATWKLIKREDPELLKKVNEPSAKEALYAYMKKAEKENREFILRRFPKDPNLFQKMFSIYMQIGDTVSFLKTLFNHPFLNTEFLEERVCRKAFEFSEGAERIHVFEAELFLSYLPEILGKLKDRKIWLHPGPQATKGIKVFLRYLAKMYPGVEVAENEKFSPGDLVIMAPFFWRKSRVIFSIIDVFNRIEKAPSNVRFVIVMFREILVKAETTKVRQAWIPYRLEKMYFFEGGRYPLDLAFLVLTNKEGEDYKVEVMQEKDCRLVSRRELEVITLWNPEILLADDMEKVLGFFQKTPKIPLGKVASVRKGYSLHLRELSDDAEDYTHRVLRGSISKKTGWVNPEKLTKVKLDEKMARKYRPLKPGDLVIDTFGWFNFSVREIPPTREKILPSEYVIVLRPRKYPSSLLRLFLTSEIGHALMEAIHISSLFLSLTPKRLRELPVPKLSPEVGKTLSEKFRAAEQERLRKIQEAEEEYRTRIKEIKKQIIRGSNEFDKN